MEKRLLLAFLLMGAVLFLMPYFYKSFGPQEAPPKPVQTAQSQPAPAEKPAAPKPAETPRPAPVARARAAAVARAKAAAVRVSAEKEQIFVAETDLYRIELSNRGAVVRSWILKKYRDSAGKPLELVNAAGAVKTGYPFSLSYKDTAPAVDLNQALYAAKPTSDGLGIDYEYSDGDVTARKTFRLQKRSYLSEFTSEVARGGAGLAHFIAVARRIRRRRRAERRGRAEQRALRLGFRQTRGQDRQGRQERPGHRLGLLLLRGH